MNRLKTIFLFLTIVGFFAFLTPQPVSAGYCQTDPTFRPSAKIYEEADMNASASGDEQPHSLRSGSVNWMNQLVIADTLFYGPESAHGCTAQVQAMPEEQRNAGLLKFTGQMVTMAFFAPIQVDIPTHYAEILLPKEFRSVVDYPAYAESPPLDSWNTNAAAFLGTGTSGIELGISKIWGLSFAFAMMGFVIVLLYAGFMIMFRQRLGGQAIVTVSMSLQNLVIGILFALASFALGGFFLNLSKFLIIILYGMFNSEGSSSGLLPNGLAAIINLTPLALLGRYGDILGAINLGEYLGIETSGSGFLGLPTDIDIRFDIVGAIVHVLSKLILAVMLFTAGFRVFFTLFTTYIRMILDIILAPVYFMVASLPGKQDGYMGWIRKMFKNALVPPMIFIFVNLALYIASIDLGENASIVESISGGAIGATGIEDSFLRAAGPQLIIAVLIFLMAPASSNILDELLGTQGSKAASAAADPVKKAASGAPIVGGFFK
ncbi:MAG: hypothetical protein QY314_00810 [Candidatus Dojkabacteria bacterium]|nr:MAG: hypothetical protein QY314_00810 [Candidatus Dojkabacteria bacterium]